jgi:hypothetical protein
VFTLFLFAMSVVSQWCSMGMCSEGVGEDAGVREVSQRFGCCLFVDYDLVPYSDRIWRERVLVFGKHDTQQW